jgi:hypothetical protein
LSRKCAGFPGSRHRSLGRRESPAISSMGRPPRLFVAVQTFVDLSQRYGPCRSRVPDPPVGESCESGFFSTKVAASANAAPDEATHPDLPETCGRRSPLGAGAMDQRRTRIRLPPPRRERRQPAADSGRGTRNPPTCAAGDPDVAALLTMPALDVVSGAAIEAKRKRRGVSRARRGL